MSGESPDRATKNIEQSYKKNSDSKFGIGSLNYQPTKGKELSTATWPGCSTCYMCWFSCNGGCGASTKVKK
ncbi:hypothetical protein [Cytobacillus kochii]|uniref:Uncharacterized protein n=1 Tax=Cytobacillus kochii TaxID=859143 RepID=A0A248TQ00_9BACI|nr:hypothetical protein [Cytobacillus kochii]ASV70209.1 hypothetical protein CKF48_23275 [Cytobacillus kochii]